MTGHTAPERIVVARKIGTGILDVMGHERTMSMGYVDSTKYIRADLVPQWQPIETAPRDGAIIAWCRRANGATHAQWVDRWKEWVAYGAEEIDLDPSHWIQLQPPPTN